MVRVGFVFESGEIGAPKGGVFDQLIWWKFPLN